MRIALLVQNFPPEFRGGTEQVVQALARSLRERGHELLVICGSEELVEGGAQRVEELEGLRVIRLLRDPKEHYGLDLTHSITAPRITDILFDEDIEVLHVHHWWTIGHDVVRRARALGRRVGVTLHDLWLACPRFFRKPIPGVRCPLGREREPCVACLVPEVPGATVDLVREQLAFRDRELIAELAAADFVTVPSQASKAAIEQHVAWDGDIQVVPHGLLQAVQEKAPPRRSDEPIRVGSFGNLVPEKGIDLLVEAVAVFGEGVELRLAGHVPEPEYRELLERRARELGVSLVWCGPYGPEDPHPALQMDIAVFPSLCQESYGLRRRRGAGPRRAGHRLGPRAHCPNAPLRGGVVLKSGGSGPLRVALVQAPAIARASSEQLQRRRSQSELPDHRRCAAARHLELYQGRQGREQS
jgi:glycosyltransferase involved in cell wall biosynthesis